MQRTRGGAGTTGSTRPRTTTPPAALVAAGLALVVSAVMLAGPGPAPLASYALSTLPALVMAACCARAARRSDDPRGRRAWILLAVAGLCWAAGELAWLDRGAISGTVDSVPSDLLFVLGTGAAAAGAFTVRGRTWRGRDRYRVVLDTAIVTGAAVFVARALGLVGRTDVSLLLLVYPLSDLVLLSVSVTLLLRTTRAGAPHLAVLALGLSLYSSGDLVYSLRASQDRYAPGSMLDLTWIAAYWLVALAALAPAARTKPCDRTVAGSYTGEGVPWLVTGLAVLSVPVVGALGPALPDDRPRDPVMLLTGFGVTITFIVRQVLLFADMARLNRRLVAEVVRKERISNAVIDGVVVVDRQSRIEFANPTAAALLGSTPSDLVGRDVADFVRRHGPDGESVEELLRALRVGDQLVHGSALFAKVGGGELPVELSVGRLDPDRSGSGVVVVFRDVSEQRLVERMKNEFMSVISHELRTPLASLRGALALLHGGVVGPVEPQGARMVSIALTSSERLSRLIDEILDVERLESGRVRLESGLHEAERLVGTAVAEMTGLALAAEVSLVVTATSGTVVADADRVVQTLTNLIGNAVKFSSPGGEVRLSAEPRGDQVEFTVADHGRGIPAEKLDVIFDRFEQVDSSDSREQGGTGLGLAICREIVRLHGGRIWVSSELGRGAEFHFLLPAGQEPQRRGGEPSTGDAALAASRPG
ncbi:sensor histidine kinase [uncultured Friedmanniella sp.]|uniref:sensor histidine kinase n=1 Tax=uncultured Friedmanniella sp. TaxID=335381 RepID=UPI0035CB7685